MPPFTHIEREVTGVKHWSNRSMSKGGWVPEPRLIAGQVWVRGKESFQVLSTEDGNSGIRTRELKFEISTLGCPAFASSKPALEFVEVESLLQEGWECA